MNDESEGQRGEGWDEGVSDEEVNDFDVHDGDGNFIFGMRQGTGDQGCVIGSRGHCGRLRASHHGHHELVGAV